MAVKGLIDSSFVVINADDYYCKNGFKRVHAYLTNDGTACMAGFVLKHTLSDHSGVSCSICEMDTDGNCTKVVETKTSSRSPPARRQTPFAQFFTEEVPASPLKADFLCGAVILCEGRLAVKVLRTDNWYGMTYKDDVSAVKESFRRMLETGIYQTDLFADL